MPFQPLRSDEPVHVHRQRLPHWRQWGSTYFVTARLGDSLPGLVLENWRMKRDAWLRSRGLASSNELDHLTEELRHEYHREFTAQFHELLDAGHGAGVLCRNDVSSELAAKLIAGHGTSYHLDAWVIMPNHVHALVEPAPEMKLGPILQRWKGGSAREINRVLGTNGQLWQRESFDHIVRSEAQRDHFRRYVIMNPEKAGLKSGFVLGVGGESGLSVEAALERFGMLR